MSSADAPLVSTIELGNFSTSSVFKTEQTQKESKNLRNLKKQFWEKWKERITAKVLLSYYYANKKFSALMAFKTEQTQSRITILWDLKQKRTIWTKKRKIEKVE